MRSMRVLAFAVMTACGGEPTPREACEQAIEVTCERLYACFTAAELAAAQFPPSESGCITNLQTQAGCAAKTTANACQGNETWHASDADACIDQVSGLECSQVRSSNFDVEAAAPACARVCRVE